MTGQQRQAIEAAEALGFLVTQFGGVTIRRNGDPTHPVAASVKWDHNGGTCYKHERGIDSWSAVVALAKKCGW